MDEDELTRDQLLRLAAESDRFDDMVEAMSSIAKLGVELTAEERGLLSFGYKKLVDPKKVAWRMLSDILSKEKVDGNMRNVAIVEDYLKRVEDELTTKFADILLTIDDYLLPSTNTPEASILYLKLKADHNAYLAVLKSKEDRQEATRQSDKAYEAATIIAEACIPPTEPLRLCLALNYSVFLYETMVDASRACDIAKNAYQAAVEEINNLKGKSYEESSRIMRLIVDNLIVWTSNIEQNEDTVDELISRAESNIELTATQRKSFSLAYKTLLLAKTASWRILSAIKSKEEANGNTSYVALVKESLRKIEDEVIEKCYEMLYAIDTFLLPSATTLDAAVFYHTMKKDYSCYLAEFKADAEREEAWLKSYEVAASKSDLPPTNPFRERASNISKRKTESSMMIFGDNRTLSTHDTLKDKGEEGPVSKFLELPCEMRYDVVERLGLGDMIRVGGVSKTMKKFFDEYVKPRLRQHVFLPSFPFHSISLTKDYPFTLHDIKRVSLTPIVPDVFPYRTFPENMVVGSIEGTVLIVELYLSPQTLLLVNPLTGNQSVIPARPNQPHPLMLFEDDPNLNNYAYGLGWARKPSEIAIIQLYRFFYEHLHPCCEMFTLRERLWVKFAPLEGDVEIEQLSGVLHKESSSLNWVATARGNNPGVHVILKLDLKSMKFSELPFKGVAIDCLGTMGGRLCALSRVRGLNSVEVSALEEDEFGRKWNLLYTIPESNLYDSLRSTFPKVLTFTDGGIVFLLNEKHRDTGSSKKESLPKQFITVYDLLNSSLRELVSPNSMRHISRRQASACVYTECRSIPEYLKSNTSEGESIGQSESASGLAATTQILYDYTFGDFILPAPEDEVEEEAVEHL